MSLDGSTGTGGGNGGDNGAKGGCPMLSGGTCGLGTGWPAYVAPPARLFIFCESSKIASHKAWF